MMDNMYYLPINRKTGLNLSMDYVKETIEVMRTIKEIRRRGGEPTPHMKSKL